MLITTGTDTIRLTLSAAVDCHIQTSAVRRSAVTPWGVEDTARDNTILATTTPTTIVAAPGTNKDFTVELLSIRNVHATASVTCLIEHLGDSTISLWNPTLLPGEVFLVANGVPFHYDSNMGVYGGVIKPDRKSVV